MGPLYHSEKLSRRWDDIPTTSHPSQDQLQYYQQVIPHPQTLKQTKENTVKMLIFLLLINNYSKTSQNGCMYTSKLLDLVDAFVSPHHLFMTNFPRGENNQHTHDIN